MENNRKYGIDIVKVMAVVFVVAIHFYLSAGYYQMPLNSMKLYIMTYFRWMFMASVPLFMMLTGYLKCNKEVNKSHYLSIIPILFTYILISIIRMVIENRMYGKIHTFSSGVKSILNYQAAWYIGMYVSLMLICPFLNKLWKSLNKKEHNILMISLIFVAMLYPIVLYVAPSYWQALYPIAYYFAGTYIRTYEPKVNKVLLLIAACLATLVNAVISIHYAAGGGFNWAILGGADNGYSVITVGIVAVAVFLIFYDLDVKNKVIRKIIKSISDSSLEIYLFQTAFNAVIYTYVGRRVASVEGYFWLFFILVPVSLSTSWVAGLVVRKLRDLLFKKL